MGVFSVNIRILSADGNDSRELEALVDTGATFTLIPQEVLCQLGYQPQEAAQFELADGSIQEYGVSPAQITLGNSTWPVPVTSVPGETGALLGATTLEIFRLAVDPVKQELVPVNLMLKRLTS